MKLIMCGRWIGDYAGVPTNPKLGTFRYPLFSPSPPLSDELRSVAGNNLIIDYRMGYMWNEDRPEIKWDLIYIGDMVMREKQ